MEAFTFKLLAPQETEIRTRLFGRRRWNGSLNSAGAWWVVTPPRRGHRGRVVETETGSAVSVGLDGWRGFAPAELAETGRQLLAPSLTHTVSPPS